MRWAEERPAWYSEADCEPFPTAIFFIEGHDSNVTLQAKLVCLDCPIRMKCLGVGMSEYSGVFGGTSQIDRNKLRRAFRYGGPERFYEMLDRINDRTRTRAKERGIVKPTPEDFSNLPIQSE